MEIHGAKVCCTLLWALAEGPGPQAGAGAGEAVDPVYTRASVLTGGARALVHVLLTGGSAPACVTVAHVSWSCGGGLTHNTNRLYYYALVTLTLKEEFQTEETFSVFSPFSTTLYMHPRR